MTAPVRTRVACFGEVLIDFLGQPPAVAGGAPIFLQHAGGAPANVAVAVARLGGDAAFVGALGADAFGDFLDRELTAHGVDTAATIRTAEAPTALAFVSLAADGERSFSFYRPPAADLLFRERDFDRLAFDRLAVFHVCSNSLTAASIAATTLDGMARARAAGVLTSMDLNLRPALWDAGTDPAPRAWAALALADLVKVSREELTFLGQSAGGEANALARLFDGPSVAVVVTDGASPLQWHTRGGSGRFDPPAVIAVDTTAAGDAFVAGMLQGLVERGIGREALAALFRDATTRDAWLRFAAATGALATTRMGAFAALPARSEVDRFLDHPR